MQWFALNFEQLNIHQLYDLLKLRCDVFVVEQCCYYPELDDKDRQDCIHVFAYEEQQLACYLRALAPGISYDEYASLGRVVTAAAFRGQGLGQQLVEQGLAVTDKLWPQYPCKISAQSHLQPFYQQFGFTATGDEYLEDDIPHIAMIRPAPNAA